MILLGADPLSRFLNRAAEREFVWGDFDCLLWLADLVAERRGKDPAEDLRHSYSSMLGAAKIVRDAGGMISLVSKQLKPLGLRRVEKAQRGDIAVVSVNGDGGEHFGNQAGAIIMNGTAAMICEAGVFYARLGSLPIAASWRV